MNNEWGIFMNNDILQTLINNDNCEEGSFIYCLHEEATFNEELLKDYLRCILKISEQNNIDKVDTKIIKMVVKTYGYILRSFLFHNHKNDCYEILNYPSESIINDYINTMSLIVEDCFLNNVKIEWNILDVEL